MLTLPLAVVYSFEALIIKILQIQSLPEGRTTRTVFRAWAPDLLFIVAILALFGVLISRRNKLVRVLGLTVFYALMGFALLITAGNYVYYSATGSNLTWGVLRYWLSSFGSTNAVASSEATTERIMWLVVQPLILLLAILDAKYGFARRHGHHKIDNCPQRPLFLVLILLLLIGNGFLLTYGWSRTSYFDSCVAFERLRALFTRDDYWVGAVPVAESERFDDTWQFVRDPTSPKLNVVVFIFESLGWKATDVYRPGLGATPFLAKLASESMVVEHAYTVVPHTTKALVSILGGYYPYLDLEPKEAAPGLLPRKGLAWVLKDLGYSTAFFQPANNFEGRPGLVANLGFEVFKGLFDMPQQGFARVNYFGREEGMMLEPSFDWVDAQQAGPFFLTYLTLSTHHNYGTPHSFPRKNLDPKSKPHDDYLNAVRYTDDFLKSVIDGFRRRGLIEKTLFIILGDHGEAFGEHGRRQHDLVLWEEGLRSMIMLYSPAVLPRGVKIDGLRSIQDVIPTVCDILGLRLAKGHFIGTSLLGSVSMDRKLYHSGCGVSQCLALHEGTIKVIYHFDNGPMEVFNNISDPFDKTNLAGKEPYNMDFLEKSKAEMLSWAAMVNGQYEAWEKAKKTESSHTRR